jgi:hypothetical protein
MFPPSWGWLPPPGLAWVTTGVGWFCLVPGVPGSMGWVPTTWPPPGTCVGVDAVPVLTGLVPEGPGGGGGGVSPWIFANTAAWVRWLLCSASIASPAAPS